MIYAQHVSLGELNYRVYKPGAEGVHKVKSRKKFSRLMQFSYSVYMLCWKRASHSYSGHLSTTYNTDYPPHHANLYRLALHTPMQIHTSMQLLGPFTYNFITTAPDREMNSRIGSYATQLLAH